MAPDSPSRSLEGEWKDGVEQLSATQTVMVEERAQNGIAVTGEKDVVAEVECEKGLRKDDDHDASMTGINHGSKKDVNSDQLDGRRERDRGQRRSATPVGKKNRTASPVKSKVSPSFRKRSTTPFRGRSPSPKRKHRGRSRSFSSSGLSRSRSRSWSRSRSRSRSSSPSKSPPSRSGRAISPHGRDYRERSRSRSPRGRDYSVGY